MTITIGSPSRFFSASCGSDTGSRSMAPAPAGTFGMGVVDICPCSFCLAWLAPYAMRVATSLSTVTMRLSASTWTTLGT